MKFIFVNLCLVSISVNAQKIDIAYQGSNAQASLELKRLLLMKYKLPQSFINIKHKTTCRQDNRFRLQFCINKKGELNLLPNMLNQQLKRSLKILRRNNDD